MGHLVQNREQMGHRDGNNGTHLGVTGHEISYMYM